MVDFHKGETELPIPNLERIELSAEERMTGSNSRSLYGNALRPQVAAVNSSHRSNSLRGTQSPYTHTDKDEQLYNLVSDLSNACRKDSNANALKDFSLIETLEKSAKDILARRNNQDTSPGKGATPVDLIQKRRRLSQEGKSDESGDDEPRVQRIERPGGDAPKRYNMPTFFSAMPRSNSTLPPSRSGSQEETPLKTKSIMAAPSKQTSFEDFSDHEDDEPSFARDSFGSDMFGRDTSFSRDTYSRETGVYSREALCMDDLSLDEINMIAPGQDELHRKRSHEDIRSGGVSKDDDDIQSIMDKAKGVVNPDVAPKSTEKEPEFVYTHLGSKLKSNRGRSGSGSKERSRRGSSDKKAITDAKLISINKSIGGTSSSATAAAAQAARAAMRSQTMLESKTQWSYKPEPDFKIPAKSTEKPRVVVAERKPELKKPVPSAAPVVEVKRAAPRKEFSLDDTIQDEAPKKRSPGGVPVERVVQEDKAAVAAAAELQKKIDALEAKLAKKESECEKMVSELLTQDAQWKTQFEASETAYKVLEKSVASLTTQNTHLTDQMKELEERIPSGDSSSHRIVWHMREILREEEADNRVEATKASKISALVNRFEKSNAQVQADFAQQLRHEIKTIGLARSASISADNTTFNGAAPTSDLDEKLADRDATIEALKREAKNYQSQLEMALHTAMNRDQDVVELEKQLSTMQLGAAASDQVSELQKALQSQKASAKLLSEKLAAVEAMSLYREQEKARLDERVADLTRKLEARAAGDAAALASVTTDLEAQRAEVTRLQKALDAKTKEFATSSARDSMLQDPVVRKSVRFDDESESLRAELKKKDAQMGEMHAALHEQTCDINALKQELLAKTETIEHLSMDFSQRLEAYTQAQRDGAHYSDPEMEKMEMFLFNQVCAKQEEVDELIHELERKDEEIKALVERGGSMRTSHDGSGDSTAALGASETQVTELGAQLKLLKEQNAHLTQETQLQARSIESKQKQIKTLLELMASKEEELAELDEALATAEMQVEHLKQQFNVSFTQEEEDGFAAAYREGGRRSSICMRRDSLPSFTAYKAPHLEPGYDEYDRDDKKSMLRGDSSATAAIDDDFAGSPRFSCLSYGSPGRDSLASRSSEWGLEF
ncbi:Aste57867_18710 [Aphanomyces stellatus]|uniref:Aste57867_18710 protein n=1 Tax=Aphanomyces stellatus TaxID=120398 RepID=A0A485LCB0_9STRA|nr:hypothetical protein As57867_018646 [Aphanomyces stellatus]VFT95444.1 Aste57867_18710 [Aphanomyces stellatus]